MNLQQLAAALGIVIMLAESMIAYPQALIIDAVKALDADTYEVTLHSASGFPYKTITSMEDLLPGDMMAAVMFNNNTPDDVRDDRILSMRYTGFYQDPEKKPPNPRVIPY